MATIVRNNEDPETGQTSERKSLSSQEFQSTKHALPPTRLSHTILHENASQAKATQYTGCLLLKRDRIWCPLSLSRAVDISWIRRPERKGNGSEKMRCEQRAWIFHIFQLQKATTAVDRTAWQFSTQARIINAAKMTMKWWNLFAVEEVCFLTWVWEESGPKSCNTVGKCVLHDKIAIHHSGGFKYLYEECTRNIVEPESINWEFLWKTVDSEWLAQASRSKWWLRWWKGRLESGWCD